ncbi:MAG TPA: FecR domain-containing protein [Steroidobacteraceae bacterium]|nr:FecR domain-containing protein [Steroidobacteraceae bacterium]
MNSSRSDDERLREAAEWLIHLSCSTPSEEDVRAWSQWCESSQDATRAFERLEALWGAAKAHPPSAQAVMALLASDTRPDKIDRARGSRWPLWRRMQFTRIKMAHALPALGFIVAAGVFCMFELFGHHAPNRPETLSAAPARQRTVVLRDGSQVDLAGRSAIEVKYNRDERLLALLSGEAYFQDKHNASWPFVVTAANVQVVATGTAFDIVKNSRQVAVSVVEGTVDVSVDGDSADASLPHAPRQPRARSDRAVFELKAGEKLTVAASGLVHFFLIDKDSAIAWREGRLEFADASLGDVIEAINRYTARPLVIADPSIAAQRFTGTVFLRSIDDWIASLPSVFQVSLDQSNPDITVLSRR